jgi:hypothetical protein
MSAELVPLWFRVSAGVLHRSRALVGMADVPCHTRYALELAVLEAAVERIDSTHPLRRPVAALSLAVEVGVSESTWRWLDYRAWASGLTLDEACAAVLEEFVEREVSPALDVESVKEAA